MTVRSVGWAIEDGGGEDWATVQLDVERLTATGVASAREPEPYTLTYDLETGPGFVTEQLRVEARGSGWVRTLDLRRAADGRWMARSGDGASAEALPHLAGALDCDLGRCPVTNSMPVLREGLLERDGTVDFVMAWVSVPDLTVHRSGQRYTTLGTDPDGRRRIRYASLESDFVSDLTFDADGLVVDYPQLARRLPS